jgi:UDP-N-acetylmuramyl pentapeptide phosphotransferase/UDP-N-acetylglucosamine-1-phosphate transferase
VPPRWALAFTVGALLALVVSSLLRRRARHPTLRSDSRRLGGVVLLAALVGLAFAPRIPERLLALAIAAVLMALVGWLAERGTLRGAGVLSAIVLVSIVPVVGGVRLDVLGVPSSDAVLSVLWIAGITAAVAGLGNTDGLLGAVVTGAAAGVFALAAFGGQNTLATLASALAGAAIGFLAYNVHPASLYVGQVGGLTAGVLLAGLVAELRHGIVAPERFVVPFVLLALPITDAIVVACGRLSHRKPLLSRRPDHMPHRLRALGWPTGRVVAILACTQLALSAIALFVGRGVLDPTIGGAIAVALVGVLAFIAVHGRVYREPRQGFSVAAGLAIFGFALLMGAASVPGVLAGFAARESLERARNTAEYAIDAARRGEPDLAAAKFREAVELFSDARDTMDNPLVTAGLAVPVLGANVHAVRTLSQTGLDLARAGERLTGPVDPEKLRFRQGTIDLAEVKRIAPSLAEAAQLLSGTTRTLGDLDTDLLIDPVRDALRQVHRQLARAERDAVRGAAAARIAPAILGGDRPRRYFLAVQNPAELRGTGGMIGNWGIITAEHGKIKLDFIERVRELNVRGGPDRTISGPADYLRRYSRFGPQNTWQNVNMSPDFGVVGSVISQLYPQSGGEAIDGVIAVDPLGLAALLRLTGPVRVPDWPTPVSADNVVDVTLRDAYAAFAQTSDRADFLGDVARRTVDVATAGDLGKPAQIANVLGQASREGHISLYFTRPEEENVARILNADGRLPRGSNDSLLLVTQNAGANKIDYYLRRHVQYDLRVEPDAQRRRARVQGHIRVQLDNTAPDNGLPQSVIGPAEGFESRFVAGENFAYVSLYTPLGVTGVRLNGQPMQAEAARELDRQVVSVWLDIRASTTSELVIDVDGEVTLGDDGLYQLDVMRQAFLAPDDVSLRLAVPPGWKITGADHASVTGPRTAEAQLGLVETTPVRVRIVPGSTPNLWDKLRRGA